MEREILWLWEQEGMCALAFTHECPGLNSARVPVRAQALRPTPLPEISPQFPILADPPAHTLHTTSSTGFLPPPAPAQSDRKHDRRPRGRKEGSPVTSPAPPGGTQVDFSRHATEVPTHTNSQERDGERERRRSQKWNVRQGGWLEEAPQRLR